MQNELNDSIWIKLFTDWDLGTWANILEVVGFGFSIAAFIISLLIKSEVKKLKNSILFDKRIKKHISNLVKSSSNINRHLLEYNNNRAEIKTEISLCIAELQDLIKKLSFCDSIKSRKLILFLKFRRSKKFVEQKQYPSAIYFFLKHWLRIYETNYDDIYVIYDRLQEIIRQMENIKENKSKAT